MSNSQYKIKIGENPTNPRTSTTSFQDDDDDDDDISIEGDNYSAISTFLMRLWGCIENE